MGRVLDAGRRGMVEYEYTLVEASRLKPHERSIPELLKETTAAIQADGFVRSPILVEDRHHIILDGHHRYEALLALGCTRIPVYLVDYDQEDIRVETWPGAVLDHVTKEEIVETVLAGERFPPKTTRHVLKRPLPDAPVKLEELR